MSLRLNSFVISVSYPAVALIALIIISNRYTGYLLCLSAVIIHESGHLLFMFLFGLRPNTLDVRLFNITILLDKRYRISALRDCIIIIAGPVLNITMFLAFYAVYRDFAYVNLYIGLFNFLPASNLDGGQLMFLCLSSKFTYNKSVFISDITTLIISFVIFFFGILILFDSYFNFSLLFIGLYLFLSVFFRKEKYL